MGASANSSVELVSCRIRQFEQQVFQDFDVRRLREVRIEPDAGSPFSIFPLTKPRQGNQHGRGELGVFPESPRDFVSIHSRHCNIEQHNVGLMRENPFDGRFSVVDGYGILAQRTKELGQSVC